MRAQMYRQRGPRIYRPKPARHVEAFEWDPNEQDTAALMTWIGERGGHSSLQWLGDEPVLKLGPPGREMRVMPGDVVVNLAVGRFLVVGGDAFNSTYEPVPEALEDN